MQPNKLSSDALVKRVLNYLGQEHSLTLAVLSPDLIVQDASEKFRGFQEDPALAPVGMHINQLLWELVGCESALVDVLNGKDEIFSLININREVKDGSTVYFSIKALPLLPEKPGQGLIVIIEDTTFTSTLEQALVQDRNDLRLTKNRLSGANEELLKLNRLKSLFLSIAAHDLRSPLTAMRGYTDLALKILPQDTPLEINEYLTIVLSLVDTQSRLISDFLDLDIIEQGNLKIRPEICHLNAIVLEVVDAMRSIANRKQVLIKTILKDDLPPLYADPDRIRQILFNLISNAVKYTNEGDHVGVETKSLEDRALFIVSDHGPGVPESDLPRLFDLYHRTEEARQSRTKGLGLGLFIVKSLVDLHHGQISVRSEPGIGTEFTVSIPFDQAAFGRNE